MSEELFRRFLRPAVRADEILRAARVMEMDPQEANKICFMILERQQKEAVRAFQDFLADPE